MIRNNSGIKILAEIKGREPFQIMEVSDAQFVNATMLNSQAPIQTFDPMEFIDPTRAESAPLSNLVAQAAYEKPSARRKRIGPLILDQDLSTKRQAVYFSQGKIGGHHRVISGHRGTVPSLREPRDLLTDTALTITPFFRKTKHFREADKHYMSVQKKYGKGVKYHLSGHSLAGTTVTALSHRRHKSTAGSIAFNAAGTPEGLASSLVQRTGIRSAADKHLDRNHAHFVSRFDPVSLLSRHRKNTRFSDGYSQPSFNPHSLTSWHN